MFSRGSGCIQLWAERCIIIGEVFVEKIDENTALHNVCLSCLPGDIAPLVPAIDKFSAASDSTNAEGSTSVGTEEKKGNAVRSDHAHRTGAKLYPKDFAMCC